MQKFVEVLPDRQAIVERSLFLLVEKIQRAVAERGQFTLALAGGSTPKPLYEAMATQELPWDKIHIFWGDERYVAPDEPESNQRMARLALLDRVPIPASNIHPMPTGAGDAAADAERHEAELRAFFQLGAGEFPRLDAILLGIGDDAHTASLFPQTAALQVRDRLITVGQKDEQPRLTFTVPLINQAECVMFLVTGANKQDAIAQIFAPEADAFTYPARFIQPQGELWWLFDEAAGANL
ncbi:6-phosphogluconolactonase [Oscillatoria amoena NRMC-F 0135]|nr:6-phosphogluconolactonase [Geitlerinema splendidum]MDL5044698.1 6-phosphogluconolactonase [Oscillatoria amoena NRMC-F 0135]